MPISVHWGLYLYIHILHLPYLPIHKEAIPQALVEVPTEAGESIEEAELEEVADAEVGDGAEVARQFVVFRLARVLECAGDGLLRFALTFISDV